MKPFNTIDEYISAQPPEMKQKLELIRQTIRKTVPQAEEVISYGIPAFRYHGIIGHFAAFKNHYSFYFGPVITKDFKEELTDFETSKGTIKIPAEKPVPVRLLKRLAKYSASLNGDKAKLKAKKKSVKKKA